MACGRAGSLLARGRGDWSLSSPSLKECGCAFGCVLVCDRRCGAVCDAEATEREDSGGEDCGPAAEGSLIVGGFGCRVCCV